MTLYRLYVNVLMKSSTSDTIPGVVRLLLLFHIHFWHIHLPDPPCGKDPDVRMMKVNAIPGYGTFVPCAADQRSADA